MSEAKAAAVAGVEIHVGRRVKGDRAAHACPAGRLDAGLLEPIVEALDREAEIVEQDRGTDVEDADERQLDKKGRL